MQDTYGHTGMEVEMGLVSDCRLLEGVLDHWGVAARVHTLQTYTIYTYIYIYTYHVIRDPPHALRVSPFHYSHGSAGAELGTVDDTRQRSSCNAQRSSTGAPGLGNHRHALERVGAQHGARWRTMAHGVPRAHAGAWQRPPRPTESSMRGNREKTTARPLRIRCGHARACRP